MKLRSLGIRAVFLFTLVTFTADPSWATQKFSGTITKLADGDTLQFLPKGEKVPFKVRMIAVDTAELHLSVPGGTVTQGYWAEMGADELAKYLKIGDSAELEVYGEDKYKRKLGRVFKNGEDINLKMIRSGWAALYVLCETGTVCVTGGLSAQDLKAYREGCNSAFKAGLGLFDPARPVPELPFVFRANENKFSLSKYVADLSKKNYVKPTEFEEVSICDRLFYFTENDAILNGFKQSGPKQQVLN